MARTLSALLLAFAALGRDAVAQDQRLPPPSAIKNGPSPLGTNLTGVDDWSTEWAFVDAFKMSRAWISSTATTWDDQRPIDVDADGWVRSLAPGQMARTLMFWSDTAMTYPAGDWLVTWEGNGALEVWNQPAAPRGARRVAVKVDPARGGIGINITAVDPAAPIKNIRVLPPGGACKQEPVRACGADRECGAGDRCALFQQEPDAHVFHPAFLMSLRSYSVLRFTDWARINNAATPSFADRAKPADARWTAKGVPLEVMCDLANLLDADPWINIPDVAEDAWARAAAQLLKERLEAGRTVWVEHSNEVWNGAFAQSRRAAAQGQRWGLSKDVFEAQLRWHARRSVVAFQAFTEVLGKERVVRVMGSQAANPWVSSTVLGFEQARAHTDALAIAPYFGGYLGEGDAALRARGMTLDQLFDELEQHALPQATKWVEEQKRIADKFGVRLVAYEGGQHLAGVGPAQDDQALDALFQVANGHPRMQDIYRKYLGAWRTAGGTLMVHYLSTGSWSRFGSWGAQRAYDSPPEQAPKRAALDAFAASTKRWW